MSHHTFADLGGLLSGAAKYLSARISLIAAEGKEAGIRYGIAAALAVGSLFVALLGYVFLVIAAVFGIAAFWTWPHAWLVVLAGTALLHLGGAVALIFMARSKLQGGVFPETMAELKNDQLWLTQLTKKN